MKTIKVNGFEIKYFDGDIAELPALRFQKFNKFTLLDAGIGADLADFDVHLERIIKYAKSSPEDTIREAQNLRQNVYLMLKDINPANMAFCALVYSVNGEPFNDLTDSGIKELYEKLNRELSDGFFKRLYKAVKKKIDEELEIYFPGKFNSRKVNEYYVKIREKTLLYCESILKGTDVSSKIEEINDYLTIFIKPLSFNGSESAEVRHEKAFADLCFIISERTNENPRTITVLEFYNILDLIKKQSRYGRQSNKNKRVISR